MKEEGKKAQVMDDAGLNWTKVGLKVAGVALEDRDAAGLNWTKVGLKDK